MDRKIAIMTNSSTPTISELNSNEAKKYYGFCVFIAVIFLPGVVGNGHILHVYIFKKKHTNARNYVLFLAVLDAINCLVNYPFNVVNCLYPYMFYSDLTCKLFTFVTYFVNIAAPLSLLLVCVDRFRVICHPFGAKISKQLSKILCAVVSIAAIILGVPSAVMYGSVDIDTGVEGIIGKECNLSGKFGTIAVAYIGFLTILSVIEALVLIVLYSLIGRAIRRQDRLLRNSGIHEGSIARGRPSKTSDAKSKDTSTLKRVQSMQIIRQSPRSVERDLGRMSLAVTKQSASFGKGALTKEIDPREYIKSRMKNGIIQNVLQNGYPGQNELILDVKSEGENVITSNGNEVIPPDNAIALSTDNQIEKRSVTKTSMVDHEPRHKSEYGEQVNGVRDSTKSNTSHRQSSQKSDKSNKEHDSERFHRSKKVTIMFFWITLVYIVSFLPNPALRVVRYINPSWYTNMNFAGKTAYHVVIGSVFLFSCTNFFIYLFCDSMFRRTIRQWYCSVFCRCRQR